MNKLRTSCAICACLISFTGTSFADKPEIDMDMICPTQVNKGGPLIVTLQITNKEEVGNPPVVVNRVATTMGSGDKKSLLANLFIQGPYIRKFDPILLSPGQTQPVNVEVVSDTPSQFSESGATAGITLLDDQGKILDSDYCFVEVN